MEQKILAAQADVEKATAAYSQTPEYKEFKRVSMEPKRFPWPTKLIEEKNAAEKAARGRFSTIKDAEDAKKLAVDLKEKADKAQKLSEDEQKIYYDARSKIWKTPEWKVLSAAQDELKRLKAVRDRMERFGITEEHAESDRRLALDGLDHDWEDHGYIQ